MSDVFLYLTTTGRISGAPRRIEIWFVEHAGAYYVIAEHRRDAQWVKNLVLNPRVLVSIGTRNHPSSAFPETEARARPVEGPADTKLAEVITALMDAKYGWSDGLIVQIVPSRAGTAAP